MSFFSFAQYATSVRNPRTIKTLRIRYANALNDAVENVRPFLVLKNGIVDNSEPDNQLEISFDEMSYDVKQYSYIIKHLNANMEESNLTTSDYIRGFTTGDITEYTPSLNTQQLYTHYSFLFPNSDMVLTASGNYVIEIYEDGNRDNVIAHVCFSVVEPKVIINASVRFNTDIELAGRYQQVDVTVNAVGIDIRDNKDIKLCVRQNNRLDNEVFNPQPTYVANNKLQYTNCRELIFEGGNEYRRFDCFSTYIAGLNIDRIRFDNTNYHAFLFPDNMRGVNAYYLGERVIDKTGIPYIHTFDANGRFLINADRFVNDMETEAEYMLVHWILFEDKPRFDGSIYVTGDLFYNQLTHYNRMLYDGEKKCYYLTSLVKQGGYDYQYCFQYNDGTKNNNGSKRTSLLPTEGSHWQTENEYTIYVYYRPFGGLYDELVGIQTISSSN